MSSANEFVEVKVDFDRDLKYVSLKHVSREDIERIASLNYPGARDLLDPDPEKADEAARRFARRYFSPEPEPRRRARAR